MTEKKLATQIQYTKLLTDIRKLMEKTKAHIVQKAHQELVLMYWNIGKRINEDKLIKEAGYGDHVVGQLAVDLGMDKWTLRRCQLFFGLQKSAPRSTFLTWSHYKELLRINKKQERAWYEAYAEREKLTRDQLISAMKKDFYAQRQLIRFPAKKKDSIKIKRPTEPMYVYKAINERVVDGDTLLVRIDLGFQVWKEQRIRLAEIDCPPLKNKKGQKAFQYVCDQLAKVNFLMIKTNKVDIYGRYVGHVFYLPHEKDKNNVFLKGRYLNQELLDQGLAALI